MKKCKYKCKNYWNYRVITKLLKDERNEIPGPRLKFPDERVFSLTEVYYKDGMPDSYVEPKNTDILVDVGEIKNFKWILKKIKKALKKPILDLDNWPNVWIE